MGRGPAPPPSAAATLAAPAASAAAAATACSDRCCTSADCDSTSPSVLSTRSRSSWGVGERGGRVCVGPALGGGAALGPRVRAPHPAPAVPHPDDGVRVACALSRRVGFRAIIVRARAARLDDDNDTPLPPLLLLLLIPLLLLLPRPRLLLLRLPRVERRERRKHVGLFKRGPRCIGARKLAARPQTAGARAGGGVPVPDRGLQTLRVVSGQVDARLLGGGGGGRGGDWLGSKAWGGAARQAPRTRAHAPSAPGSAGAPRPRRSAAARSAQTRRRAGGRRRARRQRRAAPARGRRPRSQPPLPAPAPPTRRPPARPASAPPQRQRAQPRGARGCARSARASHRRPACGCVHARWQSGRACVQAHAGGRATAALTSATVLISSACST